VSIGGNTLGVPTIISNGTAYFYGGANITLSQTSNTIAIVGGAGGGGGFSAGVSGGNSGGTTGLTGSQLAFVGGSNITLSQATNSNGATISINGATAAGITTGGVILSGSNTTGGSSSNTYAQSALNLSGAGIISLGWSANTLIISAPGSTALSQSLYAVGNTTQSSSGATSLGALSFSGAGNVSVGVTGNIVVISGAGSGGGAGGVAFGVSTGGNTTGNTGTFNSGSVALAAVGAMSLSQATGTGGASISILGPATSSISGVNGGMVSTAGNTINIGPTLLSRQDLWPMGQVSSQALTAQSNATFRYIQLDNPVTFSRVDVPAVFALQSAANANTADLNISSGLVIYSFNGSTLSPIIGAFGTTTYTWASNSSGYANLTGGRNISFPIAGSLSAGEYWIGFQLSTTNNSSIGTATTQLGNTIQMIYGVQDTVNQYGDFGSTYAASKNISSQGVLSASITGTAQTIALSNLVATGTGGQAGNFPVIFRNY
jgi:hypothetical protein